MAWDEGKRWSDRFLPEMKAILGQVVIGEPPVIEDQTRNTDLIVLKMEAVRIACRIRKFEYYEKYSGEFTIRSRLASRKDTELQKMMAGWGDYIFYGFADATESFLHSWFIGDLAVFRLWYLRAIISCDRNVLPGTSMWNKDKQTQLTAFSISDLPSEFVVGSSAAGNVRSFAMSIPV